MGNTLGSKKTTKVMKIDGETFKLRTPIQAGEVLKDYQGFVLLESEAVKHYGTRAKPLEPQQNLKPKRLYFLVEMPANSTKEKVTRRVRSGINMSAKDRLESLMLARRSTSDLSIMKPSSILPGESPENEAVAGAGAGTRVRMRLPKAEVEKLMKESKDEAEVAEKIVDLCLVNKGNRGHQSHQQVHWNEVCHGRAGRQGIKAPQKRVSFGPINEAEIQIAVASQ
ncbi:hypothetical protein UlMin_040792 [Ulmus minor]